MKQKQKLKRVGSLSFAILATLTLCIHPIKQAERPYEPEISICCGDDEPVELRECETFSVNDVLKGLL